MEEFTQGYKEFVVNYLGVVLDGTNKLLGAHLARFVNRWAVGCIGGILDFCAVVDGGVAVRVMLGLLGIRVVKFCSQLGNVVFHREAAGALVVVPFQFDACVEVAYLVDRHFLVVAKCIEEVVGVVLACVFNAKIVHY